MSESKVHLNKAGKPIFQQNESNEAGKTRPILDLKRTVANNLFEHPTRPWNAIRDLANYIPRRGVDLPYDQYDEIAEGIWVHITAYIAPDVKLKAPTIICGGARISHRAHICGSVIGSFANVGDSCFVQNSILFDKAKLCGHNSIHSSVIGYESILGIGCMIPDERLDRMNVTVTMPEGIYITGRSRLGAVVCDGVRCGAGAILNPGSVLDTGSRVFPLTSITGYLPPYAKACSTAGFQIDTSLR